MRQRELLNQLRRMARQKGLDLDFVRHGGAHDIYRIGEMQIPIPRHNEINENTARSILRRAAARLEGK